MELCKDSSGGSATTEVVKIEDNSSSSSSSSSLWVTDGSVDLRGQCVLRENTGCWKASIFIVGVEFCERLTYYCIASNLLIYLTTSMHQGVAYSAKNVNYWSGVSTILPVLGAFLADCYLGQYMMVLVSSSAYISGLLVLTLSASLPVLKPSDRCGKNDAGTSCSKATGMQLSIFWMALYLVAVGTSGHKPALQAFGADQFDEGCKEEKIKKLSFFNWWYFGVCMGTLVAVTVVAYLQQNTGSGWGFGIPTIAMSVSVILFLNGTPFYRHKKPRGSPVIKIVQVMVASFRNRKLDTPSNSCFLYEKTSQEQGHMPLPHTNKFKCLNKAAIIEPGELQESGEPNPWKLCTVTQIEETKLLLGLFPIWVSCIPFGISVAQGTTFFIKQGTTMDRRLGPHIEAPANSMVAFSAICGLVFVVIYDRCMVPVMKKFTGNERGITVLQRIGIGMVFSVASMVSASISESFRVKIAKNHGLLDSPKAVVPFSVFWLVPQYSLLGIADVFTLVGLQEYFYGQVPDSMRSLGVSFYLSVMGVSSFVSGFLINIVDDISETAGHGKWFPDNLNRSRLGQFYCLLAVLGTLNLGCFVYLAKHYTYKSVKQILPNNPI